MNNIPTYLGSLSKLALSWLADDDSSQTANFQQSFGTLMNANSTNESNQLKIQKNLLNDFEGVTLQDDPSQQIYPMPADCVGKNDVFVGRIRKDLDRANGFHMWVVSDNLLKGAAWNSVQIAESLIKLNLV